MSADPNNPQVGDRFVTSIGFLPPRVHTVTDVSDDVVEYTTEGGDSTRSKPKSEVARSWVAA